MMKMIVAGVFTMFAVAGIASQGASAGTPQQCFPSYKACTDACKLEVGNATCAYLGFSMGTVLGVPSVASEPRIQCAVFAIGGVIGGRPNLLSEAAVEE